MLVLISKIEITILCLVDSYNGHSSAGSWSRNAGTFYCNRLYYNTLYGVREGNERARHGRGLLPVVFVHLPPLHEDGLIKIEQYETSNGKRVTKIVDFTIDTITEFVIRFAADVVNSAHHSTFYLTKAFSCASWDM